MKNENEKFKEKNKNIWEKYFYYINNENEKNCNFSIDFLHYFFQKIFSYFNDYLLPLNQRFLYFLCLFFYLSI